jgi:uncharacterized protein (DUF1501 family)
MQNDLPGEQPAMNRRRFLLTGAALGCSAAASPLLTPVAFAQAPWENRLVVIILRGAMDGLDAVQPYGDRDMAGLRKSLGVGEAAGAHDLDGFFALHPGLSALMPLWDAGELGFAHAVSTPYRDKRSHFDGQDILEAGIPGSGRIRDGWLNRMLATVPGITAETAFAVGREQMLILSGDAPASRWSPEVRMQLSPQARRLLDIVYENDPLFHAASSEAIALAESLDPRGSEGSDDADDTAEMMAQDPSMQDVPRNKDHVKLAEFAAERLRGATRIASFSLNGWDTHLRQDVRMGNVLGQLSDIILTLRAGLGPAWGQTAVVCMTEFGRTARENGTRGTDHGTGGAMIFAGGAVRGGRVLSDWPGLGDSDLYAGRDLMPTRDVRAHAGWIMRGLFGMDASQIEGAVFPGLDLGADPGLLL